MDTAEERQAVSNSNRHDLPKLSVKALASLAEFSDGLQPLDRVILIYRILDPEPVTLELIAQAAELSKQRIQQRDQQLTRRLRTLTANKTALRASLLTAADNIRTRAGHVVASRDLEDYVSAALADSEAAGADEWAVEIGRRLLRRELGYTCFEGDCLDENAIKVIAHLESGARSSADDVGLIEEALVRDLLPDQSWNHVWDSLIAKSSLHRFSSFLALRNTAKARTKAALLSIGRPATKEEIGELCGLEPSRAGAQLSLINGIVRADKYRWGMESWIDDEYQGIVAEIVQRVREDGGATRLARLLEELPRRFGVSENSVRAYVSTAKFAIANGYVSLADPSSVTLRPLDDVVHGRTLEGHLYWKFKVEDRFLNGYSLPGVPPEIVTALGCTPDGRKRVPVSEPAGCPPVSVSWPLDSTAGANVGFLSEPLQRLGTNPGDEVWLVLDERDSVSFRIEPVIVSAESTLNAVHDERDRHARELLGRIKDRRRVL